MTPKDIAAALTPLVSRVRRSDHWMVAQGGSPVRVDTVLNRLQLERHVMGHRRLGACPMERGSSTTRLALLDLDSHKGQTSWPDMIAAGRRLQAVARMTTDIEFIPFRSSGGQGIHMYAIWDTDQDAHSVRVALRDILTGAGFKNGTKGVAQGQVEIFPKQATVPEDGHGSMFVLPMSGQSLPIGPDDWALTELADDNGWLYPFPSSGSVPFVAPTVRPVRSATDARPELRRIASALDALDPNDLDYQGWWTIVCAVANGTEKSADGYDLIVRWSERFSEYDPDLSLAETDKQWGAVDPDRPGGITVNSLFASARQKGWRDPVIVEQTGPAGLADLAIFSPSPGLPALGSGLPALGSGLYRPTADILERAAVPGKLSNLVDRLRALTGDRVAYDAYRDDIVLRPGDAWKLIEDADISLARKALEELAGVTSAPKNDTRDALRMIARENPIDTAQLYLAGLPEWDGVDRVDTFAREYLGAGDTAYTRAVSRYMLTALVGRILNPGAKADMVPVLIGKQGTFKSTSVEALAPPVPPLSRRTYTDIALNSTEKDISRLVRGKLVVELSELRGLSSADEDFIKAWIARREDSWVPKYEEFEVTVPRRFLLVGTANRDEFLADDTGNRRWLPVKTGVCRPHEIRRDLEQLLAEAILIHAEHGIDFRDAERLGAIVHPDHYVTDLWDGPAEAFLELKAGARFTLRELFAEALHMDVARLGKREEMRMGRVLGRLGCERIQYRDAHGKHRGWYQVKPVTAEDLL